MLKNICDFFWPRLDPESLSEIDAAQEAQSRSIEEIGKMNLAKDASVPLDFARAVYDEENERNKTADNKAFQYLLVAAAIISLLTYLEASVGQGKLGTAPNWLTLPILLAAVLYLVRAALWALRAVSTRTYNIVGAADVAEIWKRPSPQSALAKEILIATLKNQDGINQKVSSVKMAAAFLSRTIFTFGLLLVVQIVWEVGFPMYVWLASKLNFIFPQVRLLLCGGA